MTELKDGKIIKTKISLEEILNKTQKYISQNFSSSLLKIKDKDKLLISKTTIRIII